MPRRPYAYEQSDGNYKDRQGNYIAPDDLEKYSIRTDAAPSSAETGSTASRGKAPKSELGLIHEAVSTVNAVMREIPVFSDDALDDAEELRLARGIDKAQQTSPRFRKFVKNTAERGGFFYFVGVCLSIMLPRLIKHGLMPSISPRLEEMMEGPGTPYETSRETDYTATMRDDYATNSLYADSRVDETY